MIDDDLNIQKRNDLNKKLIKVIKVDKPNHQADMNLRTKYPEMK